MNCCKKLFEIYKTTNGAVYQCDRTSKFIVDFAGFATPYNVPTFLSLVRRVENIDLEALFNNLGTGSDIEIINPCLSDRIYVLSLAQVVEFKELLTGAKVMLDLNRIIRESVVSVPA